MTPKLSPNTVPIKVVANVYNTPYTKGRIKKIGELFIFTVVSLNAFL